MKKIICLILSIVLVCAGCSSSVSQANSAHAEDWRSFDKSICTQGHEKLKAGDVLAGLADYGDISPVPYLREKLFSVRTCLLSGGFINEGEDSLEYLLGIEEKNAFALSLIAEIFLLKAMDEWMIDSVGAKKSTQNAIRYAEDAISHGDKESYYLLSVIFLSKRLEMLDISRGMGLLKAGARRGSQAAQESIAKICLRSLHGENCSEEQTREWVKMAQETAKKNGAPTLILDNAL